MKKLFALMAMSLLSSYSYAEMPENLQLKPPVTDLASHDGESYATKIPASTKTSIRCSRMVKACGSVLTATVCEDVVAEVFSNGVPVGSCNYICPGVPDSDGNCDCHLDPNATNHADCPE